MRNNPGGSRRHTWLTVYRFATVTLLVVLVAMGSVLMSRSFLPISTKQVDKVEQTSTFLQDVGFTSPIYLGIQPGSEGKYPTFRVTAIGGQTIDVWIRSFGNGALSFQPVGYFGTTFGDHDTLATAYDLEQAAEEAVYDWKHLPATVKPRTDGAYGDYESAKYDYKLLAKYAVKDSKVLEHQDETSGWPRK